jgi:hypothetical protein
MLHNNELHILCNYKIVKQIAQQQWTAQLPFCNIWGTQIFGLNSLYQGDNLKWNALYLGKTQQLPQVLLHLQSGMPTIHFKSKVKKINLKQNNHAVISYNLFHNINALLFIWSNVPEVSWSHQNNMFSGGP